MLLDYILRGLTPAKLAKRLLKMSESEREAFFDIYLASASAQELSHLRFKALIHQKKLAKTNT